MRFAFAAAVIGGLAASALAAPMFSFEGNLNGFAVSQGTGVISTSTIGATDGTGSMKWTYTGYGHVGVDLTDAQWAEIYTSRKIRLDYTLTAPMGSYWGQLSIAMQSSNSGWANPAWTQVTANPAGTYSYTFDLSGINMAQNPGSSKRLYIMHNTGPTAGTMYVDNVQVLPVPEPTALGVLGSGALLLAGRRRRLA